MSFISQIDLTTAFPVAMALPSLAPTNPDGLFELGLKFSAGRDVAVDLVAAHKWFNLAALKGRQDAISMRREVAEMMSDDQIALAQREARSWVLAH